MDAGAWERAIFRALARALGLTAVLVAALWFLDAVLGVLLIFAFIAILAIALAPRSIGWRRGGCRARWGQPWSWPSSRRYSASSAG